MALDANVVVVVDVVFWKGTPRAEPIWSLYGMGERVTKVLTSWEVPAISPARE